MLIPLEWFCGCALLLTFNCVIFDNTNSIEITLPQSLDRLQALVSLPFYGDGFIIKKIWFSGMVKRECIRFICISFPAR